MRHLEKKSKIPLKFGKKALEYELALEAREC